MNIIKSIYNEPEKWCVTTLYAIEHIEGVRVRINKGFLGCAPLPNGKWSFIYKLRVWVAFKWWCEFHYQETFYGKN